MPELKGKSWYFYGYNRDGFKDVKSLRKVGRSLTQVMVVEFPVEYLSALV